MTTFILTLSSIHLALAMLATWTNKSYFYGPMEQPRVMIEAVLILTVAPVLGAWFGAALINDLTPRRLFESRRAAARRRIIIGAMTAIVSAGLQSIAIAYLYDSLSDPFILAGCGVIAGATVALLLPRVRPGHCTQCGYNMRGSIGSSVCPECGRDELAQPA